MDRFLKFTWIIVLSLNILTNVSFDGQEKISCTRTEKEEKLNNNFPALIFIIFLTHVFFFYFFSF